MSTDKRLPYKIAGPATWELIRAAYLAGESAPALAERFGVGVHGIRKRITVEKWTKRDYAAALEARGLEPPQRPKPLNVAERFAANYAPPPAPVALAEPEHPFAELVSALKEASAAARAGEAVVKPAGVALSDSDAEALLQQLSEEPSAAVASLERRALAQVGAALAKGKASDAKALVSVADQMRKRVEHDRAAVSEQEEAAALDAAKREAMTEDFFHKVAFVAGAMVHAPATAPASFHKLIAWWRIANLGEGEEDAVQRAEKIAEAKLHLLRLDWPRGTSADVREHLDAKWRGYLTEMAKEA